MNRAAFENIIGHEIGGAGDARAQHAAVKILRRIEIVHTDGGVVQALDLGHVNFPVVPVSRPLALPWPRRRLPVLDRSRRAR